MLRDTQLIILAAGKGSRMNSELPKVLLELHGKPMIQHLFDNVVSKLEVEKPLVVVGYKSEKIKNHLGASAEYVHQTEQLGTGHAVRVTEDFIDPSVKYIVVLYGDMPLVSAETIENLAREHGKNSDPITMGVVKADDFDDWRACLCGYGRILRDTNDEIVSIVEIKDATEEEKQITELNPSFFFIEKDWLFKNLTSLRADNKQHEYYLTDIVALAQQSGVVIKSVQIDSKEALGANTPEDLLRLEKIHI